MAVQRRRTFLSLKASRGRGDMYYVKVKRERIGICNLCLKIAPLSWDHVPPQGCAPPAPIEIKTILKALASTTPTKGSVKHSQNGVKYRTICKPCNEWLGRYVDPTLIHFARSIRHILTSELCLPSIVDITTKPNRLIRSILAHIVSAKTDLDEVIFDKQVRDFVIDFYAPIPEDIFIFYWVYPYEGQVILRDFVIPSKRGRLNGDYIFCQLLKFFPIAFLVCNAAYYEHLPELTSYRRFGADDIANVPLDLRNIRQSEWPETPDNGNILFGGQAMISSIVGTKRGNGGTG